MGSSELAVPVRTRVVDGSHQAISGVVRLLAEVRLAVLVLAVVADLTDFGAVVVVVVIAPFSYVPARSWERRGQSIARSGILLACDLIATTMVLAMVPGLLGKVYVLATAALLGVIVGWRLTLAVLVPLALFVLPLGHMENLQGWIVGVAVIATMVAMSFTGATLGVALRRQWWAAEQLAALQARRAATTERVRIARDVHDTVAGDLAGTILVAQVLRDQLAAQEVPPRLRETAAQLVDLCTTAHRHTREAITQLRQAELHPADELDEMCAQWSQRSGIDCSTQVTSQICDLDPALFVDVRAMLTELLENVHRHSGARRARVEVDVIDKVVVLRVADDGHGLPEPEVNAGGRADEGHFGLVGIDERAAGWGGHVTRSTALDGGLDTVVRLPWRESIEVTA